MLVPGLVILFLFLMIPLLRVLVPSVFTGDYPFSAYVDFFKDEYYRKIFLRTVKIAVITTFVCMVGGIPTAYFISRCDKKWRGLLLSASIFPMMTNSVIRSFAWINILGSNGIIKNANTIAAQMVSTLFLRIIFTSAVQPCGQSVKSFDHNQGYNDHDEGDHGRAGPVTDGHRSLVDQGRHDHVAVAS